MSRSSRHSRAERAWPGSAPEAMPREAVAGLLAAGVAELRPKAASSADLPAAAPAADKAARDLSLDALRGLVMILMVFGHAWDGLYRSQPFTTESHFRAVYDWIYFFHMPTLFVVSGYLFFLRRGRSEPLAHDYRQLGWRLLYPLALWSYVFFGSKLLASAVVNTQVNIADVIFAPFPPREHFWFLWTLLAIQALCIPLRAAGDGRLPHFAAAFGITLVGAHLLGTMAGWSPWITPVLDNAPYFAAGALLSRTGPLPWGRAPVILAALAIALIAPSLVVAAGATEADLWPIALRYACMGALLVLFASLARQRAAKPLMRGLAVAGAASMSIYMLHVFITAGGRALLQRAGLPAPDILALSTAAGVVLPVIAYFPLRKAGLSSWLGLGR